MGVNVMNCVCVCWVGGWNTREGWHSMSALSVIVTEDASGVCVINRIQKRYSICVCGRGGRIPSISLFQLFFPHKSLFHQECEYQLENSLLCDCCQLS